MSPNFTTDCAQQRWLGSLEADDYLALFTRFPPDDFQVLVPPKEHTPTPCFALPFDVCTTLESDIMARLKRLPGFSRWRHVLRWRTLFVGSTISEYAPIAITDLHAPEQALAGWEQEARRTRQTLLILKDLAHHSPLLSQQDNEAVARMARAAQQRGWMAVEGQALAYVPIAFADGEAWLQTLSASRRRDLRRKLRSKKELDISVRPLGDACFAELSAGSLTRQIVALYEQVYAQSEIHFDHLSAAFFHALLAAQNINGVVFLYRLHSTGELIGANICLVHDNKLIDKYIALSYPKARELNLYFISWQVNLDYACRHGLQHYVAGWTDPAVKASLGAQFTATHHWLWVPNPVLRAILKPLRSFFEADRATLADRQTT